MTESPSDGLSSFYNAKPATQKKREFVLDYENNPEYQPKNTIKDLDEFRWSREKIGNLIINKMKTSGGTDVDWLIEHNGGFIIFEVKRRWSDTVGIKKAQILLYRELKKQLDNCHIFLLAHDGIDFTNPNDFVYVYELGGFIQDPALTENIEAGNEFDEEKGPRIPVRLMEPMTVDGLREKIDDMWTQFDELKKKLKSNQKS